ncbi:cell wall metabolism sensor histidine kinase WalK [Methylosinus sp. PW1]|uniref:sensor histidine kinase n=1 Tax=Methylosinus sp. PW1 TaxID=107636 RepID=UPI00055A21AC|nr:HAMP domain-containing sensor histidine kinase [Methylosinus sp. PW1]
MTRASSLARRTVSYLIFAQILAFILAWVLTLGLGLAGVERFTQSWDELAAYRTADLVADSLTRDAEGNARIVPTPELEAETRRFPSFKFAAFEFKTKAPVAGSSPELVATLARVIEVNSTHTHFVLPGDPEAPALGFMARPVWTPHGRFQIAAYRARFQWTDIFHSMRDDFVSLAAYVVVVLLITGSTAWFAVSRGLAPLREAARQVAQIDVDTLNRRLLQHDVPIEVVPFVDAVNDALTRLDAWAARQRRFTANAAHELRTPLAVMRARLENAKISALRSELSSDASQLRSIVEQMLIATRLFEGQAPLDQTIDLADTLGRVVSDLLPLALDCERYIDFESDAPDAAIRGNRRAVECVVANLIDNAIRAEAAQGTIFVRLGRDAVVSIIDHGEGVATAHREMVFEPFWRESEKASGTGLGLAIAKEIMDAHRGRIWVEDTPGGGATFKLAFPPAG